MNDEKKTKKQLIEEFVLLRREISKLKASKAGGSATKSGKQGTKGGQHTYRELLMRTFANLPDAFFIVGAERAEIIDCNPAASNIFGYARSEMLGRTTTFLHNGQTGLEEFRRHLYPAVEQNSCLFLPKVTMKRKNGEVFSTEHTVIPFKDEGKGAIGWVSVVRDITDRDRAEDDIRRLSEQLSLILDSLPVALFMVKPEDDYAATYVSPNIKAITGFESTDFTARASFWFEHTHPEDVPKIMGDLPQLFENGHRQYEYRLRVANDTYRWFNERVRLTKSSDGTPYVVGIMEDITQLKQAGKTLRESEERYRALAESAEDYIFVVDKDGYVKYVNNFAANEFGCQQEEMVGKRIHELFPPDLAEHQMKNIQEVLKSGSRADNDMLQVFPNRTVWIDTSLVPLRNETGEADSVIGISRDITRRKEAEEALQKNEGLAKKLAQENSTIAEISRVISSTLNIEEVYDRFAKVVQKLLPFDRITVSLNNVEDKTVRIAYLTGMDIETVSLGTVIPLAGSLNEQLLEKRAAIAIQVESEEGALKPSPRILAYYRAGIRSMISVPLISKGEVIGGLHIGSVKSNVYTEENLRISEKIAIQISGAIANAQLFDNLKKTKKGLEESEERYRLLVENATEGVFVAQEGRINFVNPKIQEISGYSQEELTARPFTDFIHPEDRELVFSRHRERLNGEFVPTSYSFRIVRKDGETRWVSISVTSIPWQDRPATLNLLRDITLQRQTEAELEKYRHQLEELIEERTAKLDASEEALSRSDQRYREIIEIAQEGVWMTDVSGKTSYVNHRMTTMLGYPSAEILSRPVSEFMAPEGRSIWDQLLRRCAAGIKDRYDFQLRTKEGRDTWAMVSSAPRYDEGGRFSGALLMVTDISERKEAVEKIVTSKKMLQRVFDGISEPLIMIDKDFVVRMLNQTAKDYYQVETFHQIIGKPLLQDFLESDKAGREVRAAVSERRILTFERRSPSDLNRFERVITYPLRENEGILGNAIIRISDITEARLLQREVIQNEKLASLGLLISSIAHEINNPNNFISFNVPILRDYLQEVLPILDDYANQHPDHELLGMNYHAFREDIFKLLGNIEHGTTRINTAVSNLREFSRKKDREGWQPVHLIEVVEKGAAICAGELKKKVKSVEISVSEGLPRVFTDPGAVEQILINLLINAIQASDKEDSWIRVRAMLAPSKTGYVQIDVSDNGCGMDENTRERIFEPFYTTKSPGTGTGLGLYVSQNLIHELGGDILVESQFGTGSTFTIQLPIEQNREGAPIDSIPRVLS